VALRTLSNTEVATRLVSGSISHGVYWDPNTDRPMAVSSNDDGSTSVKPFNTVLCQQSEDTCVFYYDQKHCVGIDAKQPRCMIGLCIVNATNTLTEVSQAIFRMRKVLTGTHRVHFIFVGQESIVNGPTLLMYLQGTETSERLEKARMQIAQELNVERRRNGNYSRDKYLSKTHYEPLDGQYQRWLEDEYKAEVASTHLSVESIKHNKTATQQQLQQQESQQQEQDEELVRQQMASLYNPDYKPCGLGPVIEGDIEISTRFESYVGCEILPGIMISKRLVTDLTPNADHKQRDINVSQYETARVMAYFDGAVYRVFCLTVIEYHHMRKETRSLLFNISTIPEESRRQIAPAYYTSALMFGHDLTPGEAYSAYTYLFDPDSSQNVLDNMLATIAINYHKFKTDIGVSWMRYYLLNPEVLYSTNANVDRLFADLSKEQVDVILDSSAKAWTVTLE